MDIDTDLDPVRRPAILDEIKRERGAHFNPDIDELSRRNLGCTLVATFMTETAKSAILTACRGYRSEDCPDGLNIDEAQYLAALIPIERGFIWPLQDVVNGNPDKGRRKIVAFVNEVNQYPGLLDIMLGIEGIIKSRSIHASGVLLLDEDPYEFGCFMRSPDGSVCCQYDLHDAEYAGLVKYDFLLTTVQSIISKCIDLLQKYGQIESNLTLRQVYEKYLHPEIIPLDVKECWINLRDGKVLGCFQFDSVVGGQGAKRLAPTDIVQMSNANGLIRLMAEPGAESPMDKYMRFKNHPEQWEKEMDNYHLTGEEKEAFHKYLDSSFGIGISQEQLMRALMDPMICSFSLGEANNARKIIGKKLMSKIPELKAQIMEKATSPAVGKYVWDSVAAPQLG